MFNFNLKTSIQKYPTDTTFLMLMLQIFTRILLLKIENFLMVDYSHSQLHLIYLIPQLFFPSCPLNWPLSPFINLLYTLLYRRYVEVL